MPDIFNALDCLKIPYTETTECEVDDWIAGYAHKYGEKVKIIISSFDSDFFQLISDNVSVLRYRGDNSVICDIGYIKKKLGILPSQYADFKSLTGDNADNIKGAEKIGPKTAALLINEYGSLENVILNAEKIKKPIVRASVLSSAERLGTNYKLIRLDGAKELPFELERLGYKYNGTTTTEVLKDIGLR